jgi:ATP-dependent exoDNAse (exonuclease V) alpha subunit
MKNRGELSTQNLNNEMQKIFNADPSNVDKRRKIERKNVTFLEDDKVIINGNNYDKGVFNGTMGIIEFIDTAVQNGEIVINFDGVGRITFTKEEMNKIDLGYAITIHKSQGSQWKYVVMAIDYSSYVLLNRQSTYTGMTRAKENLFLVTELKALQYSIDTDKSSDRNTFLIDFLRSAK